MKTFLQSTLPKVSQVSKPPKKASVPKVIQPKVYVSEESWKEAVNRGKRRREPEDVAQEVQPARCSELNDNEDPDLAPLEKMDNTKFTGPTFEIKENDAGNTADKEGATNQAAIEKMNSSSSTSATSTAEKPKDEQVAKLLDIINKGNA